MGRRILVTGATGFVGRRTCRELIAAGHRVTATGRNEAIGADLTASGAAFVPADVTDAAAMLAITRDVDCVVHCAAHCAPWGSYRRHHATNVMGTANVVAACERNDVPRLIHVSTPSVYYQHRDQWDIAESAPISRAFVNNYTRSKAAAERLVAAAKSTVRTVVIRPKAIFGPGDATILPRIVAAAKKLKVLPVFSASDVHIDFTYVDNVAIALRLAVQNDALPSGSIFNITNGEPVNLVTFLQDLLGALDIDISVRRLPFSLGYAAAVGLEALYHLSMTSKEPPLTRYGVGTLAFTQTLSIRAAQDMLGYVPAVSLQEGLHRTVQHFQRSIS